MVACAYMMLSWRSKLRVITCAELQIKKSGSVGT
jgi:hypothetical protein